MTAPPAATSRVPRHPDHGPSGRFVSVFDFGPGAAWLEELAAVELPPPPPGTPVERATPDRIVEAGLRGGGIAVGKPVVWARAGAGWVCLIIWSCRRGGLVGPRPHARWGSYVYDQARIRDRPTSTPGAGGVSFAERYLPGFDETLAEARAALTAGPPNHR